MVTKNKPFDYGLIGINCFGFGGANGHAVLKPYLKEKQTYPKSKYRLVFASGRTPEAVDQFFDGIVRHQDDEEFLALVDDLFKTNVDGHLFRGYENI